MCIFVLKYERKILIGDFTDEEIGLQMVDNSLTTVTLILKGFSDTMLFTSCEFSNWSFLSKLQGPRMELRCGTQELDHYTHNRNNSEPKDYKNLLELLTHRTLVMAWTVEAKKYESFSKLTYL